ncbi:hypothetical protein [Cellulomonas sp.]|uniref:hypothetical protein n=1 Tax=Cellulomonas sp. TaxID=40001 RepID=UPI00258684B9|nr:hypothetical protein [Cellulomonas sp.]MCR6689412.1 hypothetical protein [Cellulomonas sp.]
MTTSALLIVLLVLAVVGAAVSLVRALRRDGHGTGVPPRSHPAWRDTAQNLPSRPY